MLAIILADNTILLTRSDYGGGETQMLYRHPTRRDAKAVYTIMADCAQDILERNGYMEVDALPPAKGAKA